MDQKRLIDWPYVIGLLLLPVAVVLVLHAVRLVQERTRYDPQFFTQQYLDQYDTPASVADDLEQALREGNRALMAQLVATRRESEPITARPSLIFVLLLSGEGEYLPYLYFDEDDYNRVIQYVKETRGRYVATEPHLYFYMDSGRWRSVVAPIATTWWIVVGLFTAGVLFYRWMATARQSMFER